MSTTGYQHTDETKQKISNAMKGRKRTRKPKDDEVSEQHPPQAPGRPYDQRNQREL